MYYQTAGAPSASFPFNLSSIHPEKKESKEMTVTTRSSARKRTPSQVFAAEPHDIRYEKETTRYDNDTFSILPIELRDRIYHECLVSPKPIDVSKISPVSEMEGQPSAMPLRA